VLVEETANTAVVTHPWFIGTSARYYEQPVAILGRFVSSGLTTYIMVRWFYEVSICYIYIADRCKPSATSGPVFW